MQRNTLVLLAIAILLSLGIWLYTAQVVMAPQTHQASADRDCHVHAIRDRYPCVQVLPPRHTF